MAAERDNKAGSSVTYWLLQSLVQQEKYSKFPQILRAAEKLISTTHAMQSSSGWSEGSNCSKALTKEAEVKRKISFHRGCLGLKLVLHLLYRDTLLKRDISAFTSIPCSRVSKSPWFQRAKTPLRNKTSHHFYHGYEMQGKTQHQEHKANIKTAWSKERLNEPCSI